MINDNDSPRARGYASRVSPLNSDESRLSQSKRQVDIQQDAPNLVTATALAVMPNWTSMFLMTSLIFGGCCANVRSLKQ